MPKETWKDVKGYEGVYQISDCGNVKSISTNRSIHGKVLNLKRERPVSAWDNGHGYLVVSLTKCGKRKNYYVHRLVAEHFVENLNNYGVVNHIDYDTKNNNADNLEWCTQKQNIRHSVVNMRKPKSTPTTSKTGEKYIKEKRNGYEVAIKVFGYYKVCNTLEEAVEVRNKFMAEHSDYYKEVI